jgi:hypothetical protein
MSKKTYKVNSTAERGHWRCGRHWGPNPVEVDEISQPLIDDPRINIVEVIEEDEEEVEDQKSSIPQSPAKAPAPAPAKVPVPANKQNVSKAGK